MCQKVLSFRNDESLESRIRFKIQDIIDSYNKEWRYVIAEAKSKIADQDGFKKIYIPKDQILTEEQVYGKRKQSFSNDPKKGQQSYFYR